MRVTVYGPLRGATGSKSVTVEFGGGTVAEAVAAFVDSYPRASGQLYDEGALRPSVRVTRDGERVDPDDQCPPDADIAIVPAMRGG